MSRDPSAPAPLGIRLGLRENWQQFSLLVLINAFVGGMVGLERTVVPLIGAEEFKIASTTHRRLLHRQLRRRQGARQPRLGTFCRHLGPQARAGRSAGCSACRFLS